MKFSSQIETIKDLSPSLYRILKLLSIELETFFNFVSYDEDGLRFGGLIIRKDGLVRSDHGIFVRKTLESESPICARYSQQAGNIAGAGPYTWDTATFESIGYFTRVTANTQIQVSKAGKYLISCRGLSYGHAAGARGDAWITVAAALVDAVVSYAGADGFMQFHLNVIRDLPNGAIIDFQANVARYGAVAGYSTLSIHKLN